MFEKCNPAHPDKVADRIAESTIVEITRKYINARGKFEKFAEWGFIY